MNLVTSHTTNERQVISRQKKKDNGKVQVNLWLSSEIIDAIDKLKANEKGRSELIENAIKHWLQSDESRTNVENDNYENFGSW